MAANRKSVNIESYGLLTNDGDYDDNDSIDNIEKNHDSGLKGHSNQLPNHSSAILCLLIILFLVDIVAFFYSSRVVLIAASPENTDDMEFKNPYVGLDALYSTNTVKPSRYEKIINEPRTAAQISSVEPNRVFPIDPHDWLSDFGVLSPPDRRFQLSPTIQTIVQFNVLDYRMEMCALALRLPGRDANLPHPYVLTINDSVLIDICELDVPRPLKASTISWSTRPPCKRSLGVIEAKVGEEVELEQFPCESGSYLGYQLSCHNESDARSCNVDVWSNQNATWGFYINQYQT